MQRALCVVLGVAAAMAATQARTETMQWKQTLTLPKGQNLPKDIKADILGIEVGDTYAELKPKLDALVKGNADDRALIEDKTTIRAQTPGGLLETTPYVGQIHTRRELPGKSKVVILEDMTIRLSAPASGNQVLGMNRRLWYREPEDQPRASEIVARLKEKFKIEPQDHSRGGTLFYRFQFDNGKAVHPQNATRYTCRPAYLIEENTSIPEINGTGDCDVTLTVEFTAGLTRDHAERIEFVLSDNERTKAAKTADYSFIEAYMRDMQSRAKGVAPKL